MQLEFELITDAEEAIASFNGTTGAFKDTDTSVEWQISDIRIVYDIVTLDSALQNSYAEHVLSGKSLPINFNTYITQYQTITSNDFAVNVSRACSRLKSVFTNFYKPITQAYGGSTLVHKQFIFFLYIL